MKFCDLKNIKILQHFFFFIRDIHKFKCSYNLWMVEEINIDPKPQNFHDWIIENQPIMWSWGCRRIPKELCGGGLHKASSNADWMDEMKVPPTLV